MTPQEEDKLVLSVLKAIQEMVKGDASFGYVQSVIRAALRMAAKQ
jgi:hypothetical protein